MLSKPFRRKTDREFEGTGAGAFAYAGLGIQFALTFLIFGWFGWLLDGKLGTEPWFMITGILLGATGAFISLVRRIPPAKGGARKP